MNFDIGVHTIPSRLFYAAASLAAPLLVAIAYYLTAQAAFYISTLSDDLFAPFWPPNVVLFCALVLVPERRWGLFLAAAFPAHVAAELGAGMSAVPLLVAFATNCAMALLNAVAVRRVLGGPPWFGDLGKACKYILIVAVASPAVAALGGAFVPILGGGAIEDYWLYWAHWCVGNALAALTLGPVFLIWTSKSPKSSGFARRGRQIEVALLTVALIIACIVAFEVGARTETEGFFPALLYSPLPLILWLAIRFGEKGASGAILVVTVALLWRTLSGLSIFLGGDPEVNVLALQLFLIGLSVPVLLLGAAIDELRRAEQATRELAGSILTARDEERRRIARDLHDSTGQNLVVASLMVGRLQSSLPAPADPTLAQLDETLQRSIRELRTVSYLLHPPLLDEAGLALALRHFVDGFSERSGIRVDLDISPDIDRLPSEVELVFFRVVQEALTNVSRHSGSAVARIRLARRPAPNGRDVVLTIEDAGSGMAASSGISTSVGRKTEPDGVGLAGMRERLHQIGGRLDIDSAPGRTVLSATVRVSGAST